MLKWLRRRSEDPETLLAQGEAEQAVPLLEAHLESAPDDRSARRMLAQAYEGSQQVDRAVEVLFDLTEDLAEEGHITKSFAVLKDIERLAPAPEIAQRAWRLMRSAAGKQSETAFKTSEIVLEDWLPEAEQREDFLASPLFQDLDRGELTRLFDELRLRRKHAGAIIYAAGQPSGGLYVLARGSVRLYRPVEEHRLEQVAFLGEGDLFGIGGVLGEGRRRHTVTAAGDCDILEIERGVFDRLAAVHPALRARIRAIVHEREQARRGERPVPPWS